MNRMVRLQDEEFPSLSVDNIEDPVSLSKALCNTYGTLRESKYKYPRASQIDNMCPREWVLGMSSEQKRSEFIHFPLLNVFNIGSAIHTYFQNTKTLFPNIVGEWRCVGCGKTFPFGIRPKGACPQCGANNRAVRYKEYSFSLSDPFYVTGKIDLFLPLGNPIRYRIGDIKGIADDKVEPRGSDIMQLATYLLCAKHDPFLSGLVDSTVGYLFYVSKKMSFKAPVRTIKVELTPVLEETITDLLMQVKLGVDDARIPGRRKNCKDKNCPFKVQCNELGDKDDFIENKIPLK